MSDAASPKQHRWLWAVLLMLPMSLLAGWGIGALPTGAPSSGPALTGSQGELSQWTNLSDAIAESKRNGKPVMIDSTQSGAAHARR